jgi:hypothetical protein
MMGPRTRAAMPKPMAIQSDLVKPLSPESVVWGMVPILDVVLVVLEAALVSVCGVEPIATADAVIGRKTNQVCHAIMMPKMERELKSTFIVEVLGTMRGFLGRDLVDVYG